MHARRRPLVDYRPLLITASYVSTHVASSRACTVLCAAAAAVRRSSQLSTTFDEHLVRTTDGLHAVADAVETTGLLARLHRAAARHLPHLHRRTTHASTTTTCFPHSAIPSPTESELFLSVVKAPKSCYIIPIPCSLHWFKITKRIEYKLLSLTYKVLTTTQPQSHSLIAVQRSRSTRSSSVVTLARPPTPFSLKN